jgi:iron complex outermembrane receptor protein
MMSPVWADDLKRVQDLSPDLTELSLEDLMDIAVIRGPGASLWGANAVRDGAVDASGEDTNDEWDVLRGGFRMDWQASRRDHWILQGDIYDGESHGAVTTFSTICPFSSMIDEENDLTGGNLMGRWKRPVSEKPDMELQLYYDREDRENVPAVIDIMLIEDSLRLTLGSKFEHNDFTGYEIQPNARLIWTPDENHSVWAAISRAVRTPSLGEDDARLVSSVLPPASLFSGSPRFFVTLSGKRVFESEELLACKAGLRLWILDHFSLDIGAFYNEYDKLRSVVPGNQLSFTLDNKREGETFGVELTADWRATDWWRFQAAYTYLQMQLELDSDSKDTIRVGAEDESPHHQFCIRTFMDLPRDLELHFWVRHVDDLPGQEGDSYLAFDVRTGWKAHKNLDISVVGQNLLNSRHPEFRAELLESMASEVERSIYGKITLHF